jgi:hypothetical protein
VIAPRTLLQLDVAGAGLTSVVHGALFATGLVPTGIPPAVLALMALAAAGFALIGFRGQARPEHVVPTLRRVALLNTLFCLASAAVWVAWFDQLTVWGLIYFPAEILVLLALSSLELRAASAASTG